MASQQHNDERAAGAEKSYFLEPNPSQQFMSDNHYYPLWVDAELDSANHPTSQSLFEDTADPAFIRWNRDNLPHRQLLQPCRHAYA